MDRSLEASRDLWSASAALHHQRSPRKPVLAGASRWQSGHDRFGKDVDVRVYRARVWWVIVPALSSFWAGVIWAFIG